MADLAPITVAGQAPQPAAPAPTQAPALIEPEAGKVAVYDTDGSVNVIAKADLARAVETEGARPASYEEYIGAKTGAVGQAASAVIGAGRGASFGFSDPAAIEISRLLGGDAEAEDTRRALNLSRRVNPNATLGGELVGSLAPLMFGAPPAGAAVAEGSMLARAGTRALQFAPRLAAEGAVIGGGFEMSEEALGNHELNAQKLVASAAGGAVFNLLLGGAAHAATGAVGDLLGGSRRALSGAEQEIQRGMGAYRTQDIERLAEREFGATEKGLGEKVRGHLVKTSSAASGAEHEAIDLFTQGAFKKGSAGSEARRIAVYEADKEMATAQRALREHGDTFVRESPDLMQEFRGELKSDKIRGLVKSDNQAQVALYTQKKIDDVLTRLDSEISRADVAPGATRDIERISRSTHHIQADMAEAIAKGADANTESFIALDRIKREMQAFTQQGYNRAENIVSAFDRNSMRQSVDVLNTVQDDLRKGLESTDLWGKAGEVQQQINAAWSQQIEASKRFHRALTTDVGRDPMNPFLRQKGIDPSKLDTYARGLLNPNQDLTHQAVKDYVTSTEALARTLRDNVTLTPERLAQVGRIEQAAGTFRKTLGDTEKTLTLVNQYKKLTGGDGMGSTLAGALGFAAGGPVGAALAGTVGALANPGKAVAQLAALERMGAKVDDKIGNAVRSFFGGGKAAAPAVERKVTAEEVRQLRQVVNNPAQVQELAARAIAPFQRVAPRTSIAAAATVSRMAAYLAKRLPPEPEPIGVSFAQREPRKMSDAQMAKANSAIQAVNEVNAILGGISRQKLDREHVTALREVYPELYSELKLQMRAKAEELKPNLSFQQQIAFSVLFNEPLHAVMKPATIRGFNKAFAQGASPEGQVGGPQPAAGPKRPLKMGGSIRSGTDALEAPDGWT